MVEYDEIAYWPNKVSLFLLNIVAYCDHLSFPSVEKSALWLSPCMWLGFPLIFFLQGVPKSIFLVQNGVKMDIFGTPSKKKIVETQATYMELTIEHFFQHLGMISGHSKPHY